MSDSKQAVTPDALWVQMCQAAGLDPRKRLAARSAILASPEARDCTVYRPDENDLDADEEDLGDARFLLLGTFEPPAEWSAAERAEFYDDADPQAFFSAFIECQAKPASKAFFIAEAGDYAAVMSPTGSVQMYYLLESQESDEGLRCVLLRDDELDA
jgi:hypothetical protein